MRRIILSLYQVIKLITIQPSQSDAEKLAQRGVHTWQEGHHPETNLSSFDDSSCYSYLSNSSNNSFGVTLYRLNHSN